MQILAATDFSTRSNRALRQAGLLARPAGAQLHVVHVVDDDQPQDLVRMETREAQRLLEEQIDSMPELKGVATRPMVVIGDPFDGILRTATECNAELIVMGPHRKQLLLDIFMGTTIERVIRKGSFPVLMVNNEAQQRYKKVVATVDMSEASANALRAALSTQLVSGGTLLHAFSTPGTGKMAVGGVTQESIDAYVAAERARVVKELDSFLVANSLAPEKWLLRVEEGDAYPVISQTVTDLRPDLLVMGTNRRPRLLKALIGSITEEALRSLNVDILTVPLIKR